MSMPRPIKLSPKHRKRLDQALVELSSKLVKSRKAMHLTQEELAERLEISLETVKAIEQMRRLPSAALLIHICLEMKITIP